MRNPPTHISFFIIPAVMMLIALLDMPYAYYGWLKIVATLSAAWLAYAFYNNSREWLGALFGLVAVTFNPIIPIHPGREVWFYLNIAAAAIYGVGLIFWAVSEREQREFDRTNNPRTK